MGTALDPQEAPAAGARHVVAHAYSKAGAAEALSVSVDFFEEHVMPELQVVRRGRRVLVPVRELERWLDENARPTL